MFDIDAARYPVALASEIAGLKVPTGRSWAAQGWIYSSAGRDKPAGKAGSAALLTGRSVIALSIAARLADMGLHPAAACRAARRFTDFTHEGEARDPAELFEGVSTALIVYPTGEATVMSGDRGDLLQTIFFPPATDSASPRQERAYVLRLNSIVKNVEIALQGRDAAENA